MVACNTTLENSYIVEEPLYGKFTFHHLGLFLCAVFGLVSVVVSLWLIWMHATHYLRPTEQRQIIRILFMIPVYSVVSFLSYIFYRKSIYFEVLRDCYEAFAISSFFALLCHYIAPNLHDQKDYFRTLSPKNWFWSVFGLQKLTGGQNKGPLRRPGSGLTWFNVIWAGIFQYCFIRVFFTIVSVISEAFGRYCNASLSPAFAHVWVVAFECISVTIAMFMVIQFYLQLKDDLSEHKPFLKVLSIKLVIFFSFWQTIVISLLSSTRGPLQPTAKLAYQDIQIGIPSTLLCIEMAGFSFMHIFAYPWKVYSIQHKASNPLMASGAGYSGDIPEYQGGYLGLKAILDAFNPWDIIKSIARGFRWIFVGSRKRRQDVSYQSKLIGQDTGYAGPTFAGTGEAATELRPDINPKEGPYGGSTDDRVGLLSNSQLPSNSRAYLDPRYTELDASGVHRPARAASPAVSNLDMKHSDFDADANHDEDDDDTDYHPGIGPSSTSPDPRAQRSSVLGPTGSVHVHPAYRRSTSGDAPPQTNEWNMFGGATMNSPPRNHASDSPPAYR